MSAATTFLKLAGLGTAGYLGARAVQSVGTTAVATTNSVNNALPGGNTDLGQYTANVTQGIFSGFDPYAGVTIPNMPTAKGKNLKDPNVMAQYQEDMQFYTQMLQLKTQIMTMLHDTRKNNVQNFRA